MVSDTFLWALQEKQQFLHIYLNKHTINHKKPFLLFEKTRSVSINLYMVVVSLQLLYIGLTLMLLLATLAITNLCKDPEK